MSINLTAPINTLGFGICGLNLLLALERVRREPALFPIGPIEAPTETHEVIRRAIERARYFDPESTSLRLWHPFDLAQHVGSPRTSMTFFELNRFKKVELHQLKSQDLVISPTRWGAEVLRANGVGRVSHVPIAVDTALFHYDPSEDTSQAWSTTVFINVGKWEVRKGQRDVIDAFNLAFEPTDDVALFLRCHNPCFRDQSQYERYNREWEDYALHSKMGLAGKIDVAKGRFKLQSELLRDMRVADCGVFPAKAEGWNFELSELLALGKHVIASNCTGHTEYCTPENARMIEMGPPGPAYDGVWFDPGDPEWGGNPGRWHSFGKDQLDQLVTHMREVHGLKREGALAPNLSGVESMGRFSWDSTAGAIP